MPRRGPGGTESSVRASSISPVAEESECAPPPGHSWRFVRILSPKGDRMPWLSFFDVIRNPYESWSAYCSVGELIIIACCGRVVRPAGFS